MLKITESLKTGFSFGLASGVITTLGLIVGLNSGTHSKSVVLGGIFIIATADAFSDAFGIHISEESKSRHTDREVWTSTVCTFLAKLVFSLTFIIPILLFELPMAIIISVAWGLLILGVFSFFIAKGRKDSWKVVAEHLFIAIVVIITTYYIGQWASSAFKE